MEELKDILSQSQILQKAEENLRFRQKWLNDGFIQISNRLLRNTTVSVGARVLYMLLMSRCFSKDFSYPGIETLRAELGVASNDTVYSYMKELTDNDWVTVKRRGQGKTNLYFLNKIK